MVRRLSPRLLLFVIIVAVVPAYGQGGPPLRTDDPGTPGNGNWEINIGLTTDRRADLRQFEAPIVDVNYGLGERIQLKFEIPFLIEGVNSAATRSGLGNSLMGVKWRFYEDKKREFSLSTYPQFEFNNPTHSLDRGLVDRGQRLLLPLEVTKKIGPVDANGEVGYRFAQVGPDDWFVGLAFGQQLTPRVELLAELYRTAEIRGAEHESTFGFGSRVKLSKNFVLISMAGRSFSGPASGQPQLIGYLGVQVLLSGHGHSGASDDRHYLRTTAR